MTLVADCSGSCEPREFETLHDASEWAVRHHHSPVTIEPQSASSDSRAGLLDAVRKLLIPGGRHP